ncbi:hypothetical protein CAPTEDRAFT_18508 [Capitella teleta]|uniref:NAD-dependent protein deacetylase n=1 Tax=Capitella teleta TaxID=283909 RepID=R7T8F1_CAPTE|nr:hypothetical protein CAPTEDRAFT_18508 [Capitella teleta]|eukprot:ELT89708.1 hypothetical protein CAPTEDRAFT_18508 [Capitella teleta]
MQILQRSLAYKWGSKRHFAKKSSSCSTIEDIAEYLISGGNQKKVVVMAGAGISTPSGIPDFRSPGTGLYDNLQKYDLPYPEAIFDIRYFDQRPEPFYTLAKELHPSGKYKPNTAHWFLRLLKDKGHLLRIYTQNIDGLERMAGIPEEKLVEAHGGFYKATCRACLKKYTLEHIKEKIMASDVPRCNAPHCDGVIKPNIVFFGEQLPERFWNFSVDMPQADLLIVMGTSLEVYPFASIADEVLPHTARLLFNMEPVGPFRYNLRHNDVISAGDLVTKVSEFCDLVGWSNELKALEVGGK